MDNSEPQTAADKAIEPTPVLLVMGPLGAGKTTLLRQLLARKPSGVTWGVLVNDFGTMSLDAQALSLQGVVVESLTGGCVCCSLQGLIVQALERLVLAGVQRILLEPSGVADARALYLALRKHPFIQLLPIIAVLPANSLLSERKSPVLRAQLALSQLIWVSHSQCLTGAQQQMISEQLNQLYPAKLDWQYVLNDAVWRQWSAYWLLSDGLENSPKRQDQLVVSLAHIESEQHQHQGLHQSGWRFPLPQQWSRPCLHKQLAQLAMQDVLRVKGLLRTGPAHWAQIDWTPYSGWQWQESDYAGDSRFEVIERHTQLDWLSVLTDCIYRKVPLSS